MKISQVGIEWSHAEVRTERRTCGSQYSLFTMLRTRPPQKTESIQKGDSFYEGHNAAQHIRTDDEIFQIWNPVQKASWRL